MSKHYVIGLAALLIVALVGIAPMASSAGIAEATAELAQSAAAFDIEAIKAAAMQFAEDNSALTIDIAQALWNYAEIGLNEYKSYVLVRDVLKNAGFEVVQSAAGVPTAIVAKWGSGETVLGIYEDYDALPDVGHGCGHNLNTAAGIVAAISIKKAMETYNIPGTIKLFITPAEEV